MIVPERHSARIALSSCALQRRLALEETLERNGWYIVINAPLKTGMLSRLDELRPDVLIVDIEEASDHDLEILKFLLRSCSVPVLITDSEVEQMAGDEQQWARRLNEKLEAMASGGLPSDRPEVMASPMDRETVATDDVMEPVDGISGSGVRQAGEPNVVQLQSVPPSSEPPAAMDQDNGDEQIAAGLSGPPGREVDNEAAVRMRPAPDTRGRAGRVWILTASLGGPRAVAQFLGGIPAETEIAFILVQRIAPAHLPMLVRQLGNCCELNVKVLADGHVLRNGDVGVTSFDSLLAIDSEGVITILDERADAQSGGLDQVMREVAQNYGTNSGAIVFSGMGDYGIAGCRAILDAGGTVWTQNAESCVIGSMPGHVRHACKVDISAAPGTLADHLIERLAARERVPNNAFG